MGWLDNCAIVRVFACTDYVTKELGIQNPLLLPRAVEVFTLLPATTSSDILFSFEDWRLIQQGNVELSLPQSATISRNHFTVHILRI